MLEIFIAMCLGAAVGRLARRLPYSRRVAAKTVTAAILILMLLLGTEVGGNEWVIRHVGSIGLTAVWLGTGTVGGVLLAAKALWRCGFRSIAPQPAEQEAEGQDSARRIPFGLFIVGAFAAGIAIGLFTPAARWTGNGPLAMWALYLLMFSVGGTVGSDTEALRNIVRQPKRSLLVPLATFVGSWVGVSAAWGVLQVAGGRPMLWSDAMAIGAGQGYYSLSGVLLAELRGPEIGTIGLLANITREMLTVAGSAWMAKRFSPLGPICSGGATTMDVSLPGILRSCGPQYAALALLQGVIADLSVPFFVPFFAGFAG